MDKGICFWLITIISGAFCFFFIDKMLGIAIWAAGFVERCVALYRLNQK